MNLELNYYQVSIDINAKAVLLILNQAFRIHRMDLPNYPTTLTAVRPTVSHADFVTLSGMMM